MLNIIAVPMRIIAKIETNFLYRSSRLTVLRYSFDDWPLLSSALFLADISYPMLDYAGILNLAS